MTRKLTVSALAATIIIVILTLFIVSNGSGVAFAEVLEHFQGSGYTCEIQVSVEGATQPTIQASVLPPDHMRLDAPSGIGDLSVIVDVWASKSMILFHRQRAAVLCPPKPDSTPENWAILTSCMKPIEELLALRNEKAEELGKSTIDGQPTEGFRVTTESDSMEHQITIWAHTQTRMPIMVEVSSTQPAYLDTAITITMRHFELRDNLDKRLFSLETPEGYTLAYRKGVEELETEKEGEQEKEPSSEAPRIEEMLMLWSQGKKDEAIQTLLAIDWSQPIEFSGKPYLFSLTESELISLNTKDQKEVMNEVLSDASTVRKIAKQAVKLAQQAITDQDYEQAEVYLESGRQLGKLLSQNFEAMTIVRLVGIAVQQITLEELIKLYEAIGNQNKLDGAKELLKEAKDQAAEIKKLATGR